ncbi:PepSY domain-containing protein [Sphingomonas aerolata]|uniref:PepSY domain-containing protein n=1 Tax=Sphingomonas aerolata TaxID=185951 RepID=UPI003A5BFAA0
MPTGARPASWQAVIDTLHREHPSRTGAWRIEVTGEGGAIPVRYYTPKETTGRAFAPLLAWVDPERLTTIRTGFWGDTLVTWIYDLHYRLLLEQPGGIAMGIAGIVMLVLLASGLWAWWPRSGAGGGRCGSKRAPCRSGDYTTGTSWPAFPD